MRWDEARLGTERGLHLRRLRELGPQVSQSLICKGKVAVFALATGSASVGVFARVFPYKSAIADCGPGMVLSAPTRLWAAVAVRPEMTA
jgi:hypothetical protein